MVITPQNVIHYLIGKGIESPEVIVDGDFISVDTSRRCRNVKVIRKEGLGYFFKQAKQPEPQLINSLQREATCYWLAEHEPSFAALKPLLPKYVYYDPAQVVLLVGLLPESENLTEYHYRTQSFPLPLAEQLGRALGSYHKGISEQFLQHPRAAIFPKELPWILSFHQQQRNLMIGLSQGNHQLHELINRYPELPQKLSELQAGWAINGLVHGDMKWDNVVVYASEENPEGEALKVIDWELADLGDTAWDTGAIFQSYLSFWVVNMQIGSGAIGPQVVIETPFALEKMQPAINGFWAAYADTMQLQGEAREQMLERCMKYAAVRMIQTTYEHLANATQMAPHTINLMQLSMNILNQPKDAIRQLLGL